MRRPPRKWGWLIAIAAVGVLFGLAYLASPETSVGYANTAGYAVAAISLALIVVSFSVLIFVNKKRRKTKAPPAKKEDSPRSDSSQKWGWKTMVKWLKRAAWTLIIAIVLIMFVYPWLRDAISWRLAGNGNAHKELVSSRSATPAIETEVHILNGVPIDPARTPRKRIPDGYEVRTTHELDVPEADLRMHCSETETGPEQLWTPHRPCVGGWVSFSTSREYNFPMDIEYRFHRVGN